MNGISLVPHGGFGLQTSPAVALEEASLTYIACCGNRLAIVSPASEQDTPKRCNLRFFPNTAVAIRHVTAISLHKRRKLLALCVTTKHGPPVIFVYSLARLNGDWIPTPLETLTWDTGRPAQGFEFAQFSSDASAILAVTSQSCSSTVLGFLWQSQTLLFVYSSRVSIEKIRSSPQDSLQVSTSGPEHMQLWRVAHEELKSCGHVKNLPRTRINYSDHEWLESGILVAGTGCGEVTVIQQNRQLARFRGIHPAAIRGIVPLEYGFATVCSNAGLCVFQLNTNQCRLDVKLVRRVVVDGICNILSVSTFPSSNASSTLLVGTQALAVLNITHSTRQPLADMLPPPRQEGNILSLSAATKKPLVASCSTSGNSIYVWDWSTNESVVKYKGDQAFVCLDMHPNGQILLAGLQYEMRLYSLGYHNLHLVQKIATKGAIFPDGKNPPLVCTAPLTHLKYANGGHMFAVVVGRTVQIFESCSREQAGKADMLHALRGHAGNVKGLAWGIEDQRLFTASDDGAIYEWSIGSLEHRGKILARTRDSVRPGITWSSIAMFGDGALVAAGVLQDTEPCNEIDASREALICVWPENLDSSSIDVRTGHRGVTTVLPINASTSCQGMLIIGTTEGSLLVATWPLSDGQVNRLDEIAIFDGPVHLTFSHMDNILCVAGSGCTVLLCRLGSHMGRISRQRTISSHQDDMLLIERRVHLNLRNSVRMLTTRLGHTKLVARRQKNAIWPKVRALWRQEQDSHEAHVCVLEQAISALEKKLSNAKDAHQLEMLETRAKFACDVRELESGYEAKAVTAAACYAEVRDEIDRARVNARVQLEQQVLESCTRETTQITSQKAVRDGYESQVRVLQQYVALAKRQALCLLEHQEYQNDLEILQAKEDAIFDISELKHMLKISTNDKAFLKQQNELLKTNYHKNQDELTEYQRACKLARESADLAKAQSSDTMRNLQTESELRVKLENIVAAQGGKLDYLTNCKKLLSEQKNALSQDMKSMDFDLFAAKETSQHLNKVLEAAGQKNRAMSAMLHRKTDELKRTRQKLGACREYVRSKNKRVGNMLELIDTLLFRLGDPVFRPLVLLSDVKAIRDCVVCLQSDQYAANADANADAKESGHFNAKVDTDGAPVVGIRRTHKLAPHTRTVQQLRLHNLRLMEELNELRFDRLSLRRMLCPK